MSKTISLALLLAGVAFIILGNRAFHSLGSDFSRLFTGNPTDRSTWFLIAGFICAGVGAVGLMSSPRTP